jgi:hypothetical protein
VLAPLFQAGRSGDLARLKTCQAPERRWVFYDRSNNCTGVRSNMDISGARHKDAACPTPGFTYVRLTPERIQGRCQPIPAGCRMTMGY